MLIVGYRSCMGRTLLLIWRYEVMGLVADTMSWSNSKRPMILMVGERIGLVANVRYRVYIDALQEYSQGYCGSSLGKLSQLDALRLSSRDDLSMNYHAIWSKSYLYPLLGYNHVRARRLCHPSFANVKWVTPILRRCSNERGLCLHVFCLWYRCKVWGYRSIQPPKVRCLSFGIERHHMDLLIALLKGSLDVDWWLDPYRLHVLANRMPWIDYEPHISYGP